MGLAAETTLPDGRVDARSVDLHGLVRLCAGIGKEEHRARQVYKAMWQRGVTDFHDVDTISKVARAELARRAYIPTLTCIARLDSEDGTLKYLWRLADGAIVESVLIPDEDHPGGRRLTLCASSQVGCAMACSFCLTGDLGLKRHMAPSEIALQLQQVQADIGADRRITNVVLMGMGEPLHNLDNLLVALRNMLHGDALNMSHRKITVSTVGLVPAIERLMTELPVNLAVSLNATTDEQRRAVMPITRRWPIADLLDVRRRVPLPSGKRITFEYVMLRGFNDAMEDARRLGDLMEGMRCKINLIPYNENPDRDLRRPSDLSVWRFQDHLVQRGFHTSVRRTRGRDISAACGQLGGAEHLARQLRGSDVRAPAATAEQAATAEAAAWRAMQLDAARRGINRRLDDGGGELLEAPGAVAESSA